MSVFRQATSQAIKEMIQESCSESRFGWILEEQGLEKACERIVDLFESTLALRGRTLDLFQTARSTPPPEPRLVPHTKNAEEIYQSRETHSQERFENHLDYTQLASLPRKKVSLSEEEFQKLRNQR